MWNPAVLVYRKLLNKRQQPEGGRGGGVEKQTKRQRGRVTLKAQRERGGKEHKAEEKWQEGRGRTKRSDILGTGGRDSWDPSQVREWEVKQMQR